MQTLNSNNFLKATLRFVNTGLTYPFIAMIRIYQAFLSPLIGSNCRFYPTCSQYAIQALYKHGLIKGFILICTRLVKCQPFHPGGLDPVPPSKACCNKNHN